MARLSKADLFGVVEAALRRSGWSFLVLSSQHPALYAAYSGSKRFLAKIYIWNLTPGGKNRPLDEWRIQITGISRFDSEPEHRTVILGWEADREVFAGFDVRRHLGPLGSSPSIQLRELALDRAKLDGIAPHNKGSGEISIAFRADFLGAYLENLVQLHDFGGDPGDLATLSKVSQSSADVDEEDVGRALGNERRYAMVYALRTLRDIKFRSNVLDAYQHRCAFCHVQLELLDGAHILPVAHRDSTDETKNGVALCALHHRAYDHSLVTFSDDLRVHVNERLMSQIEAQGLGGGLAEFRGLLLPYVQPPRNRKDRPDPMFVKAANGLRGWMI